TAASATAKAAAACHARNQDSFIVRSPEGRQRAANRQDDRALYRSAGAAITKKSAIAHACGC
ncbi:TPA: hypothetical protein ACKFH8_005811, partial [Burkholderia multivorans]